MIMFKIGSVDYSNRVIAEKYNVNKNKLYQSWTDANGTEHRSTTRTQVVGSFSMFFPSMDEFVAFTQNIQNESNYDMSVPVIVCDNKTNTQQSIDAFIDYAPSRKKNGLNEDVIEIVKINITER